MGSWKYLSIYIEVHHKFSKTSNKGTWKARTTGTTAMTTTKVNNLISKIKTACVSTYQTVTTSCEYVLDGTDLALARPSHTREMLEL